MLPRKLVHHFKQNDQQKANHVASSLVTSSSSTPQYITSQLVNLKVTCGRCLERRNAIADVMNEHVVLQCVSVQNTIKKNNH